MLYYLTSAVTRYSYVNLLFADSLIKSRVNNLASYLGMCVNFKNVAIHMCMHH